MKRDEIHSLMLARDLIVLNPSLSSTQILHVRLPKFSGPIFRRNRPQVRSPKPFYTEVKLAGELYHIKGALPIYLP